ncbi:hypothetical protein DRN67_02565 [Candidatus Micrarchaeota archaeon]|nr:MAG: hypothetical protein DRN67_02565 [Candidatus Micrarchaeota archaeon]
MKGKTVKLPGGKNGAVITSRTIGGQRLKFISLKGAPEPIRDDIARKYPRTIPWKNRSAGALVRHNYRLLVEETQGVMREGLESRSITTAESDGNIVEKVKQLCLDHDGLDASKFKTTKNEPMKRNRAFLYMIQEFFRDLDTIKLIFKDVKQGMEQEAKPSST